MNNDISHETNHSPGVVVVTSAALVLHQVALPRQHHRLSSQAEALPQHQGEPPYQQYISKDHFMKNVDSYDRNYIWIGYK